MITVGITGGIGSGKTTVCKEWEKLGAVVVYADELAKELMVTNESVRNQLISVFGKSAYKSDGTLNKSYLIKEAFEKNRVNELNKIVHPAVAEEFKKICKKNREAGSSMVVKEAALLLNNGRPPDLDKIVIVLSNRDDQVKRVIKRDSVNETEVQSRMQKQPDFNRLTHLADFVIKNEGTLDDLKEKARELFQELS